MLGQGSPNIETRALGIVTERWDEVKGWDEEDKVKRVYVRWAVSDLKREVPARGCFQSIHGPFKADDEWTRLVFQL
jgi:hypothetical protein